MLCIACFQNWGLREEAARIAPASDGSPCPNCGGRGPRLATQEQVDALIERFFVHGSTAPTGRWEPIYRHSNEVLQNEDDLRFDRTLRADYALLCRHDPGTLFLHAPRTWRLGYTTIERQLTEALETPGQRGIEAARDRLDHVIDYCRITTVPPDAYLYRIRRNVEQPYEVSEYDSPQVTRPSRFTDGSVPVLYAAFDVETCLHEGRVLAEDTITLATLQPTRTLRVLDLTNVPYDPPEPREGGEGGNIFYFANSQLIFGVHSPPGQRLGVRCRERELDGIVYPSYFSGVRPDRGRFANIAVFGHPVQEGQLRLHSLNNVRIDTIHYAFTHGPVTQGLSEADTRALQALAMQDWSGRHPSEMAAAIKNRSQNLLSRRITCDLMRGHGSQIRRCA